MLRMIGKVGGWMAFITLFSSAAFAQLNNGSQMTGSGGGGWDVEGSSFAARAGAIVFATKEHSVSKKGACDAEALAIKVLRTAISTGVKTEAKGSGLEEFVRSLRHATPNGSLLSEKEKKCLEDALGIVSGLQSSLSRALGL